MKRHLAPGGSVKSVFVFALMAAFALMSLLIVILGAKVYRVTADRSEENLGTRLSLSYISNKVRAGEEEGMVSLSGDMLILTSRIEGKDYNTYIYYQDGAICEYFGGADRPFDGALGEKIVEVDFFSLRAEGDMLYIEVSDASGIPHGTALFVRTGITEVQA